MLPEAAESDDVARAPTQAETAEYVAGMLLQLAQLVEAKAFGPLHSAVMTAHAIVDAQHRRMSAANGRGGADGF